MKHRWVERVLVTLMVIGAPLWGMPSDAPESPSALYKAYWGVDTNLDGWASPEELVKHVAGLMEWTTYQDNNYVLNPLEFVEKGGGDCDDYATYIASVFSYHGWNARVFGIGKRGKGMSHAVAGVALSEPPPSGDTIYYDGAWWLVMDYDNPGKSVVVPAEEMWLGAVWEWWELAGSGY